MILNEIVENIYKSGWLLRECKKITHNKYYQEEMFQEIVLIILTYKPESSLQLAFQKKEHLPFIKRIILNQFNSRTSPFYKKYKKYEDVFLYDEKYLIDNND